MNKIDHQAPSGIAAPVQSNTTKNKIMIVVLVLVLFAALSWGMYRTQTYPDRYANRDFMSLWAGGRAILTGLNPYDPDVWEPLRRQYGSTWIPDDRAPFPLWTLMWVLPFAALNLSWGAAAWLAFSLILLGATIGIMMLAFRKKPLPLAEFTLLALGAFTLRGGLVTLNNGQITYLMLFILALALFLAARQRQFWFGFALAFVILKPNPFILFVPLVAVWLIHRRRWRAIGGTATGGLTLLAVSWAILPGWLFEWLDVRDKAEVSFITPTVWGLGFELAGSWWLPVGLALAVGVTAVLGWYVLTRPHVNEAELLSLAVAGSLLVTPYAWDYEHLLLLLPAILLFLTMRRRWLAIVVWLGLTQFLPWVMYWIAEQKQLSTMSFLIPLVTGLSFLVLYDHRPVTAIQPRQVHE